VGLDDGVCNDDGVVCTRAEHLGGDDGHLGGDDGTLGGDDGTLGGDDEHPGGGDGTLGGGDGTLGGGDGTLGGDDGHLGGGDGHLGGDDGTLGGGDGTLGGDDEHPGGDDGHLGGDDGHLGGDGSSHPLAYRSPLRTIESAAASASCPATGRAGNSLAGTSSPSRCVTDRPPSAIHPAMTPRTLSGVLAFLLLLPLAAVAALLLRRPAPPAPPTPITPAPRIPLAEWNPRDWATNDPAPTPTVITSYTCLPDRIEKEVPGLTCLGCDTSGDQRQVYGHALWPKCPERREPGWMLWCNRMPIEVWCRRRDAE
jgi:hypothetical protein